MFIVQFKTNIEIICHPAQYALSSRRKKITFENIFVQKKKLEVEKFDAKSVERNPEE